MDVYYHDWAEVDPERSWTGLCKPLDGARYIDVTEGQAPGPVLLFDYARPDIVIAVNGQPVVSLEQTRMNPSGHNIPQRFSSVMKAAELGVAGIIYCPMFARRSLSDANPRFINPRVPLAQLRVSQIFQAPSLTVYWPTDPKTLLPVTGIAKQKQMSDLIAEIILNANRRYDFSTLRTVEQAVDDMTASILQTMPSQRTNASVRRYFPAGIDTCATTGQVVDPPPSVELLPSTDFVWRLESRASQKSRDWASYRDRLLSRTYTLVFSATTNAQCTDSEHPYPGYLSLLDALYARDAHSLFPHERKFNLVYWLGVPGRHVPIKDFIDRMSRDQVPTATYIVDTFADLICMEDGAVPGRPFRGVSDPKRLLAL